MQVGKYSLLSRSIGTNAVYLLKMLQALLVGWRKAGTFSQNLQEMTEGFGQIYKQVGCFNIWTFDLTMLNLTLFIHHVFKVLNNGESRQVMEGFVPQVLVNFLLPLSAFQERLDVKGHLPSHGLPAQQS